MGIAAFILRSRRSRVEDSTNSGTRSFSSARNGRSGSSATGLPKETSTPPGSVSWGSPQVARFPARCAGGGRTEVTSPSDGEAVVAGNSLLPGEIHFRQLRRENLVGLSQRSSLTSLFFEHGDLFAVGVVGDLREAHSIEVGA